MPEYNYVCPNCEEQFIVNKKISEYDPHEPCPKCGEKSNRDMTKNFCNGNYIVNMSGFYGKTSH
jgi:putative FmdB family regulatory protein